LLPGDMIIDGKSVTDREPQLTTDLATLLSTNFAGLFDAYLYYAKVDADVDNADELYRMTESAWKALLKDAQVLDSKKYQVTSLTTMQAAQIFKLVNQRRENLEKGIGRAGGVPSESTNPAAISAAVQSAVQSGAAEQPSASNPTATDVAASVLKPHFAGGSLFSFTFSEFLEGLVFVALQLFPPQGTVESPSPPLSAAHVLDSVRTMIVDRVLRASKRSDSLAFRRDFLESNRLVAAMEAIRGKLDALHSKYAKKPKVVTAGLLKGSAVKSGEMQGLLDLKRFQEMCAEAELIGPCLSRAAVKNAFVYSLELNTDETGVSRPMLAKGAEFAEAVLRLTGAYDPSLAPRGPLSPPKSTPGKFRKALPSASNAGMAASAEAAVVAAMEGSEEGHEEEATDKEADLLEKLPVVCGKLLALVHTATPRQAPTMAAVSC